MTPPSGASAAAGRGRASSGRGTSAARPGRGTVRTRTGITLDPNDPDDAKILQRQQQVAVKAGREGRDRAKVTGGRPDLEAAYESGAGLGPVPLTDEAQPTKAPAKAPAGKGGGKSSSGGDRYRQMGPGWSAVKPASPAKLPTKAADAGGFLTGLALYTVAVIYIRYGPEGWKGWLKAKFLNQPMPAAGSSNKTPPKKSKTPTKKSGKAAAV